jgi:hypothetical protein
MSFRVRVSGRCSRLREAPELETMSRGKKRKGKRKEKLYSVLKITIKHEDRICKIYMVGSTIQKYYKLLFCQNTPKFIISLAPKLFQVRSPSPVGATSQGITVAKARQHQNHAMPVKPFMQTFLAILRCYCIMSKRERRIRLGRRDPLKQTKGQNPEGMGEVYKSKKNA